MKVVLRNRQTEEYFHGDQGWTTHRSSARAFDTTQEAVLFAVGNSTASLEVVLTADNSGPDISIPVSHLRKGEGH